MCVYKQTKINKTITEINIHTAVYLVKYGYTV